MNAVFLPTACAAGGRGDARHRTDGNGCDIAMASRVFRNDARGTSAAVIRNGIDLPCRTILAPIFARRSRGVVIDR